MSTPRPDTANVAPPELWAIVGGISDYAGPSLHLTYPAKDAADFAHALTLAAKNLFGADKVHLTLLDTGGQPGAAPAHAKTTCGRRLRRRGRPSPATSLWFIWPGMASRFPARRTRPEP